MVEGPSIQHLTRRLAECPPSFLAEPRIAEVGVVHVDAVVADLMGRLGTPLGRQAEYESFRPRDPKSRNTLRVVLIAAWLLHDAWFQANAWAVDPPMAARALYWMQHGLTEFAGVVTAEACVEDPDRREEFARRCMKAMGALPLGESEPQAGDRLATLNSVEQRQVLRDSRKRQKRADQLRRKLEEQRAREAAARYARE